MLSFEGFPGADGPTSKTSALLLGLFIGLFLCCNNREAGFHSSEAEATALSMVKLQKSNAIPFDFYWSPRPTLIHCGRRLQEDMKPRRQELMGEWWKLAVSFAFCFLPMESVSVRGSSKHRDCAHWQEENFKEDGRNEPKAVILQPHLSCLFCPFTLNLKQTEFPMTLQKPSSSFLFRSLCTNGFSFFKLLLSTSLSYLPLITEVSA